MGVWRLRNTVPALYLALLVTASVLLIGHHDFARRAGATDTPSGEIAPGTELGNTFEGFGCANWSGGRFPGRQFAIAAPVRKGGALSAVWVCWKTATGYGDGTFGRWRFELRGDAPDHSPLPDALAIADGMVNPPDGYWRIALDRHAPLTPGGIVHLVMTNTDPDPTSNWSCPNTIMSVPELPGQATVRHSDGGDTWLPWGSVSNRVSPGRGGRAAYLLQYADGTHEGMPYYSASFRTIWGTRREGQRFTWRGPETQVRTIGVPVCAAGPDEPTGPLTLMLEEVGDRGTTLLATVELRGSAGAGPGLPLWVYARLPGTAATLRHGATYRLSLAAPGCDQDHAYGTFVPYSSNDVPGWADLTWGGAEGRHVFFANGQWHSAPVPADLTFSMVAE